MPEPEVTSAAEPIGQADAASADARSTEVEGSSSEGSNGWTNLFGLLNRDKKTAATETNADATSAPPASSQAITLTPEELDRRIQSETDRREAKRQREQAEATERERLAAVERKLDPRSPDYDPYAGAEERDAIRAAETAGQQFTELLGGVGKQHDAVTLDVIVEALPAAERDRIFKLEGAGVGLDGRKLIVSEGLKALEKHWRAEGQRAAEQKLREDGVFRKQVFAEHRDQVDEPELLPSNGSVARGDAFMNQIFSDYKAAKGRRFGRRRASE